MSGKDKVADALLEAMMKERNRAKGGAVAATASVEPPPKVEMVEVKGPTLSTRLKDMGITFAMPSDAFDPPIRAMFSVDDWDEEWQEYIPSNTTYQVVEGNWDTLAGVVLDDYLGMTSSIVGWQGTGKTAIVEFLCYLLQQPFVRVNYFDGVESDHLIGHYTIRGGASEYEEGIIPKAARAGCRVHHDEWQRAPAGVRMALQWLTERGGKIRLLGKHNDDLVTPDPRFRQSFADNTRGLGDNMLQFGTAFRADTSSINRVDSHYEIDYMPRDQEAELLRNKFPHMPEPTVKNLVKVAHLVRNGFKMGEIPLVISLRNLFTMCEKAQYMSLERAFTSSFTASLPIEDQGKVREIWKAIFA